MADDRITYLFDRYISGACTPAEKQELAVLGLMPENQAALDALLAAHWERTGLSEAMPGEGQAILAAILGPADPAGKPAILRLHWKKLAVAASILLILGLGGYFLFFNKTGRQNDVVKTEPAPDVEAPKITKATITLADGRTISVDSLNTLTQSNVQLSKTADGKIVYSGNAVDVVYNTLTNPRGSTVIDMSLADGSHIWLNAGSSVTYPVAFTGSERRVSITGEAYFEVSHDPARPFFVSKGELSVKVLGTHFNVNAYDDESDMKVTLLEGSVEVSNNYGSAIIKPGEQARITSNLKPQTLKGIDVEAVMAWKNNKFIFNSADIRTIGRQLEKWYDVEFIYVSEITDHFTGIISRSVNASDVFSMLQKTGTMNVRIENKKVYISE